jgi:hypothetical protein
MSISETFTQSYTTADVGKVLDCFAADFDGISQSTGLRTHEEVVSLAADVKLMAQLGYLREVDLCLYDGAGRLLRAAKYEVSTDAGSLTAQRPGNNLWPRTPEGQLRAYMKPTRAWRNLGPAEQQALDQRLSRPWSRESLDSSFPTLTSTTDRTYESNGFGLVRSIFR